jgi:ABC-2 type transport system ATP-binding protein
VFLTTHYMLEADEICDRIAVIKKGEIVAKGTPSSIKTGAEDQGIVEFEVEGLPADRIATLRQLPAVATVIVDERELAQVITIHCSRPGELAASLGTLLAGTQVRKLTVREATLEDAYVLLVT